MAAFRPVSRTASDDEQDLHARSSAAAPRAAPCSPRPRPRCSPRTRRPAGHRPGRWRAGRPWRATSGSGRTAGGWWSSVCGGHGGSLFRLVRPSLVVRAWGALEPGCGPDGRHRTNRARLSGETGGCRAKHCPSGPGFPRAPGETDAPYPLRPRKYPIAPDSSRVMSSKPGLGEPGAYLGGGGARAEQAGEAADLAHRQVAQPGVVEQRAAGEDPAGVEHPAHLAAPPGAGRGSSAGR